MASINSAILAGVTSCLMSLSTPQQILRFLPMFASFSGKN
jgi:hypothetical protein